MKIFDYLPGLDKKITKLRIPVSGSVNVCESVLRIIDSHEYQRLRGVRQLGPTIFVFPGANHTRFEHSLGVYNNALLYLEKLLAINDFKSLFEPIEKNIRIIILSSLLHDLGHYPYSHWIEEIGQFKNGLKLSSHEQRSINIIKNSIGLSDLIKNEWGIDIEDLQTTIRADTDQGKQGLLNSFLSSIIDIDKIDYLRRDSIHCGVDYGRGIDMERLIESLYVDRNETKNAPRICITDKGKSVLMTVLNARITMYQEIYWHKTVRICDAMFKRFFYEFVDRANLSQSDLEEIAKSTDDELTANLFYQSLSFKDITLTNLIKPFAFKGRCLYKLLYKYDKGTEDSITPREIKHFFAKISDLAYHKQIEVCEKLSEHLSQYCKKNISALDILIESAPVKKGKEEDHLSGFRIYNIKVKLYENYPRQLNHLNKYLEENQQGYILCSQNVYAELKKIDKANLENILCTLHSQL